ncbi:MAG: hypothetical protein CSA62_08155 [Planctomycetota bacterium]|nr:MAG: hypothetical protein CSA62_08155 [Planctomycetota bacterium]
MGKLLLLSLFWLCSCVGSGVPDPQRLALLPPLPYRIAVGGGAMLATEQRDPGGVEVWKGGEVLRTYDGRDLEPVPFAELVGLLRRGRLASQVVALDMDDLPARERLAFGRNRPEEIERARLLAEGQGADLLLILEGLRDAPVIELGLNDRWPIATAAWLMVGLGMFIPDHSYESQVSVRATLRDVHTGAVLVDDILVSPGSVDLSLVERTTWLGIVTSILVPPPLVWSEPEEYGSSVREVAGDLIALRLLARLKRPQTLAQLRRALPLGVELVPGREGLELVVRSRQELLSLAVEMGAERRALAEASLQTLLAALRASRALDPAGEGFVYRAPLPASEGARLVRVIVGTAAGERVSTTWHQSDL